MNTAYNPQTLHQGLSAIKIIPQKSLDEAYDFATQAKQDYEDVLLDRDLISPEHLGRLISELVEVPYVNLEKQYINPDCAKYLPEDYSKDNSLIVFSAVGETLKIAFNDPKYAGELIPLIEQKTGLKVDKYYSTKIEILDALTLYNKDLYKNPSQIVAGERAVENLIRQAYESKASDIHIESHQKQAIIRFRVDGMLYDILKTDLKTHTQLINKIKVLAKLRTDEHLNAQDGRIALQLETEELDVRVSVVPFNQGEKAVLRLLSERARHHSLESIGLTGKDLEKVTKQLEKPYGTILSTGPTGSGKTTTIYALLKLLNTRDKNISTIEDPVEYNIEGINQIQVRQKTNLTFANGLRSLLRQDPNIIFVGEIRDAETAGIAINASMTGHLVISTLHTKDAPTAFLRLADMDIEPYLIASTVNLVIGQRLARKICENCKVSYQETSPKIKSYFPNAKTLTLYKGKGCDLCNKTGYLGRIGIFEVMEVTDPIRELVKNKSGSEDIMDQAVKDGMTTMFDDGLEKCKLGLTTIEEILRVTQE